MKPKARQTQIAESIGQQGPMSVDLLAAQFAVSPETIRRDLAQLAERGLLQKVHGGARPLRLHAEPSFQDRMAEDAAAKQAIAQKLVPLIAPGDTLFIDTGSTTLAAASALAPIAGLTVITNSLRIARIFGGQPGAAPGQGGAVYLLGGRFAADNSQTVGPLAIAQIAAFQADHAVLTVAALDADAGAMDADFDEAQVARAMIGHARNVVVLATTAKLGRKAGFRVCALAEIGTLVTDAPPPAALAAALHSAGVAVA